MPCTTNRKRILYIGFCAIALALATGISWKLASQYYPEGYCHAQQRYLSDEEFVENVLRRMAYPMGIENSRAAALAYHKNNPDCCRFRKGETSLIDRMLGTEGRAGVELRVRVIPERNAGSSCFEGNYGLNSCGEIIAREEMGVTCKK
jgi:hypothetical protein